jgi:hypothetical protein
MPDGHQQRYALITRQVTSDAVCKSLLHAKLRHLHQIAASIPINQPNAPRVTHNEVEQTAAQIPSESLAASSQQQADGC